MKNTSILLLAFTVFFVMGHTTTKYFLVKVDDGVVKDAYRLIGFANYIS